MIADINTAILDTPRAPQCEPWCTPEEGCEVCFVYVCRGCGERKPWDNGGTDDERCDECWLSTERKKRAPSSREATERASF